MVHPYSRRLDSIDAIEDFLFFTLRHPQSKDNRLLSKIFTSESELNSYSTTNSTLLSTSNRDRKFKTDTLRWDLRKVVVKELHELHRIDNDDKIKIGKGGACPNCNIQLDKQAFIIIGLPASGKSGIANKIADHYGAYILDSDFAKRKLPEFKNNHSGASLVHEESDKLIFGFNVADKPDDFRSLSEICLESGVNIVIPKIGHQPDKINNFAASLKKIGYACHLILVSLDRRLATKRAIERFKQTKRYVPLSLIFDGYGNDPILTFYRLKDNILNAQQNFDSFGKISTDVSLGQNPKIIYCSESSPVAIFK